MTNQTTRNSFVLYQDNSDIFQALTKEQQADLIMSIFAYQKTGELPSDPFIKIAISSFVSQFKRDSQKWEKTCQEKTIAGKMGNLKRWHPELYKKVMDGKISLDDAMLGLQPQEPSQPDRTQSDPIGEVANIAVNVNDSVSVNDIINTNSLKSQFEEIYRLYNQGKTIKVVPFDRLKVKFQNCLKEISFEELKQNIEDYLKYLATASWRQKKAFDAWINSSESYANDWKNEGKESSSAKALISQDSFCQSLNQVIGQNLIKSISDGEITTIKLTSASANDKWDALTQPIKDSVIVAVKSKFGKNIKIIF